MQPEIVEMVKVMVVLIEKETQVIVLVIKEEVEIMITLDNYLL